MAISKGLNDQYSQIILQTAYARKMQINTNVKKVCTLYKNKITTAQIRDVF